MIAYHFVGDALRDGRPVPADGVWLEHDGPIEMCQSGLHASLTPWEALVYAPGSVLCRVELGGEIVTGDDKVVASRRRILGRADVTDELRAFARAEALVVSHLWACPDVVRQYLETGDDVLRDAAWTAARGAASAARAAASAAWGAALAASGQRFNAAMLAALEVA